MELTQENYGIADIVQKYGKRLLSFIRKSVGNIDDADDILQDVWYNLISFVNKQPIENISAWLYTVSKNRIIDRARKNKTLSFEDFIYENEDGELIFPDESVADYNTPDFDFDNEILRKAIVLALDELPEKQRQVFVLNEIEDMALQEIADLSGESIKTIISRKGYAVKQLKKRLQEIYDELFN